MILLLRTNSTRSQTPFTLLGAEEVDPLGWAGLSSPSTLGKGWGLGALPFCLVMNEVMNLSRGSTIKHQGQGLFSSVLICLQNRDRSFSMASTLSEEFTLFWFLLFDILWANFKSPHIKSKLRQWRCHLSGDLRGASVFCYCHESEFQYWWWMLQHLLGILVSNLGLWQWDKLLRLYENICIWMNTGEKNAFGLFQIVHLLAELFKYINLKVLVVFYLKQNIFGEAV